MAKVNTTLEGEEGTGEGEVPVDPPPAERQYLRSKTDGHLFSFSEFLLPHNDLEQVGEAEAYPERNVPLHVTEAKAKAKAKDDKAVDLAGGITDETVAEKDPPTDPALAKQAAKGWPK